MSDAIKHECGIAMIRLLKPLDYYRKKYGTSFRGLDLLYLMMEKQHNRGQEGAGMACVKLDTRPGEEYLFRERALGTGAIGEVFDGVHRAMEEYREAIRRERGELPADEELPFVGEIYLGHLRYSTTGRSGISYTHPFLRRNNWQSRNLCVAGNFNLTNVDEILADIVARGQHPRHNADTFIMLEQLGYLLDAEVQRLYDRFRPEGLRGEALNRRIEEQLDIESVIRRASSGWDGGFVIVGATGSGESFVFRDRWGIRPAYYYADEEIVAVASERPVLQTVLNVGTDAVRELPAGGALVITRTGEVRLSQIAEPVGPTPCSFERIYFSRGTDRDIYRERKALGRLLAEPILNEVGGDFDRTIFSFIPNTAEVAYYGMMEGLNDRLDRTKAERIAALERPDPKRVAEILAHRVRTEKLAVKDIKLRTFIAEGTSRNDLAAHVYDITYGTVRPGEDAIVVIDDSIVRGTTLRRSIVKILSRLSPRRIVVVSSSPQVRYPDCYGIDMARMGEFIAFAAAVELLRESGREYVLEEVYRKCREQAESSVSDVVNYVKEIYAPFSDGEISERIARMITPEGCGSSVTVVYQSLENLHRACPNHGGDWYFSGNYPTPGGVRLVCRAYMNWYEGNPMKR